MRKNWIKIASIYVGTVIGAGFASGREIVEFFGAYGVKGIWGMYISGILFAIIGSLLLVKIHNNKIQGINELTYKLFGSKMGFIVDTLMAISMYTGFSIMVSGSGAIFEEQLGLSFNMGILIMIIFCFIVFLFDLEGLSFINTILVPLLIIGILSISYYLSTKNVYDFSNIEGLNYTTKGNFITSAILYFGSNSLILIVVFSTLYPLLNNKRTAIIGGIAGGGILYILGISILYSMLLHYNESLYLDIPMLKISNDIGASYGKIYSLILWVAMFTTALSNGFGFINRFSKRNNKVLIISIFSLSTIPLAKFGFARLVGTIYPVFGVIGIITMILVLLY